MPNAWTDYVKAHMRPGVSLKDLAAQYRALGLAKGPAPSAPRAPKSACAKITQQSLCLPPGCEWYTGAKKSGCRKPADRAASQYKAATTRAVKDFRATFGQFQQQQAGAMKRGNQWY